MGDVEVIEGDCLAALRAMPDASVDAVVTDPPSGINFMNLPFDSDRGGRAAWVAWLAERLAECYRVAKPGSRALVWALPRTSHWTGTAVEDAGWTIEDRISHMFGTGYPKHESKLKPACEDWWLAIKPAAKAVPLPGLDACRIGIGSGDDIHAKNPHTNGTIGAKGIYGPGTPTMYEIPAGRWPANVVFSHIGGPDGCRPVGTRRVRGSNQPGRRDGSLVAGIGFAKDVEAKPHPATFHTDPDEYGMETIEEWQCVDGCPVAELDRQSGILQDGRIRYGNKSGHRPQYQSTDAMATATLCRLDEIPSVRGHVDSGGASRFIYVSKASPADRGPGNLHPTVKSTDLMAWLVRLICPVGGLVLDPFAGSGSTLVACRETGRRAVGVEVDAKYCAVAWRRLKDAELPLFDR